MNYLFTILPRLFDGFIVSLIVYFFTLLLSIPLGFVLSLLSLSKSKTIESFLMIYTWVLRGTPLLLQLYLTVYALPLILPINLRESRIVIATLTFVLNYSAYFLEIFKGGLLSIPKGQWQASKMLQLTDAQTLCYIIIPQVIRNTLYPITNEAITLVKDTSLLAAVAIPELLMVSKEALSRDSRVEGIIAAGLFYLIFTFGVVQANKALEKILRIEVTL